MQGKVSSLSRPVKIAIAIVWVLAVVAAFLWRVEQPFDDLQPFLFGFGLTALLHGGANLYLEWLGKEARTIRILLLSIHLVIIGLILAWWGIRIL